jgi:hypothetical protein
MTGPQGSEVGQIVVILIASGSSDDVAVQCLVANTPAAAQRLHDNLRAFRERYRMERVAVRPFRGTQGPQEGQV